MKMIIPGSTYLGKPTLKFQSCLSPAFESDRNNRSVLLDNTDWYSFTLEKGEHYEFTSSGFVSNGVRQITGTLYLLDHHSLVEIIHDDGRGYGSNFIIRYTPSVQGTYYLKVITRGSFFYTIHYIQRSLPEDKEMAVNLFPDIIPPLPEAPQTVVQPIQNPGPAFVNFMNPPAGTPLPAAAPRTTRRHPASTNGNKRQQTALTDSPDTYQPQPKQQDMFPLNEGFSVHLFAKLDHFPGEGFNQLLLGANNDFVMVARENEKAEARKIVWYSGEENIEIAGTIAGVTVRGLAYGGPNTILAITEDRRKSWKIYQIKGSFIPTALVKYERRNIYQGDRRNGDRRSGSDRRKSNGEER